MARDLLGDAYRCLLAGEFAAAEALCRKALRKPRLAATAREMLSDCYYNQGVMHVQYHGLMDEAEKAFLAALDYNPRHAKALNNLGALKESQGRIAEAVTFYHRALELAPDNVETARNLAVIYQKLDETEKAGELLAKLCAMDPANGGLYRLRRALLVKNIVPDAAYPAAVRGIIDGRLDEILAGSFRVARPEDYGMPYFFLSYHGLPNREINAKIARAYLHLCPELSWEAPGVRAQREPGQRVRVGIASANLFNHSIGHTTRGLVEKLDRDRFEVFVVRFGQAPGDGISRAIDRAADAVCTVPAVGLREAREKIASLALDILFYQDIGMEPFGYLLAFSRLAPVQVTSFGHPDTTGIPNVDYFISSSLYEVEQAQDHYTETLLRLPDAGTLAYYYRPGAPDHPVSRDEFGLSDDANVYFCPQALFKVHPVMDEIFSGIVKRDPKALILLIGSPEDAMRRNLENRLRNSMGSLIRGVRFVERIPHDRFLRLMSCADVMLDTVHFNGQNTNLEAFALGLPVVTWPGVMQRERHTLGMYQAMGLSLFADLIAGSVAEYAEKAVLVATDRAHRKELQSRIAEKCGVLYENRGIVRSFEAAFVRMLRDGRRA
jgi:protein O-GlcNAc transferase